MLPAAAFGARATYHCSQQKSPGQLVFGRDMIQPINHKANCRLIRQRKQAQKEKDIIHENSTRVHHNYIIGYWVMVREEMALNTKHHLKVRIKSFKHGQAKTLPFKL